MTDPTPSEAKAETTSLGDLFSDVSRDLSTLIRQEAALAKAEIKESASKSARGAGLLGVAGYAGLMAIFFLSFALWWAFYAIMPGGWAAVVVALIWGVIAAIGFVIGRKKLKEVEGIPQTVETVKEIPETLKRNEENR